MGKAVINLIAVIMAIASPDIHAGIFQEKHPSIFVSIASYRDRLCPTTVEEIYNKADHPERIHLGIYQQNDKYDISCQTPRIPEHVQKNITLVTVPSEQARGPSIARYHAAQLYKGEDYFLQIDSHLRFVQGWDTKIVAMRERLAKEKGGKSVISLYLPHWDVDSNTLRDNFNTQTPQTCGMLFHKTVDAPTAIAMHVDNSDKFHESYTIAGGFMFAPGSVLKDVPFDPNLHYLFHGEELMYSVRLWEKGYRIYNPLFNVAAHYYERPTEPKVWGDHDDYAEQSDKITTFVMSQLGLLPDSKIDPFYPYGVSEQTLREFYAHFKIDPLNKTSVDLCEETGALLPQPYLAEDEEESTVSPESPGKSQGTDADATGASPESRGRRKVPAAKGA